MALLLCLWLPERAAAHDLRHSVEEGAAVAVKLSFESVKRIDRWSAELAEPLTDWLEMTPINDPLSLREGKKLRLSVSFEGRPAQGVIVSYDGKPRGTTGRDGRINIRLRHGGFQVIQASLTGPDASGKADEVVYAANLNFELPEE